MRKRRNMQAVTNVFMTFFTYIALGISSIFGTAHAVDLDNTIFLEVKQGRIVIDLDPSLAPENVARIKELTRAKFYDGNPFFRVIPKYIAQTGDPAGSGTGGTGHPIKAEFSDTPMVRGVVAMARLSEPDTADSQFFIITAPEAPQLQGQYTVIGKVLAGIELVDQFKPGDPNNNGFVHSEPELILSMRIAKDMQDGKVTPY